jgi:hypothetical protein
MSVPYAVPYYFGAFWGWRGTHMAVYGRMAANDYKGLGEKKAHSSRGIGGGGVRQTMNYINRLSAIKDSIPSFVPYRGSR